MNCLMFWSVVVDAICTAIIGISVLFLWFQIRSNHQWNRRLSTLGAKMDMVLKEFPDLRDKLEADLQCDIWDKNSTYEDMTKNRSPVEAAKIDKYLGRILNYFEVVCIQLKNNILNEEICYDYLGWIMTEYYRWSKPYIVLWREEAHDSRVLGNFEIFAKKWTDRIEKERKELKSKVPAGGTDNSKA